MEAENIPPAKGDKETLASSPKSKRPLGERNTEANVDVKVANGFLVKPQIFLPCSSKRQSPSSHYDDDVECSPRKKAKVTSGFAAGKAVMKNKQNGFLFGSSGVIRTEATNSDEEGAQDILEPPRLMAKAKPWSGRAKVLVEVPHRTALPIKVQFQDDDLCSDDGGPPRSQSTASLDEGWSQGSSESEVGDLLANVSVHSALSSIKGDSARHPIFIDL